MVGLYWLIFVGLAAFLALVWFIAERINIRLWRRKIAKASLAQLRKAETHADRLRAIVYPIDWWCVLPDGRYLYAKTMAEGRAWAIACGYMEGEFVLEYLPAN